MRAALLAAITFAAPCIARAQSDGDVPGESSSPPPAASSDAIAPSAGPAPIVLRPRRPHFYPVRRPYRGGPIPLDMTVVRTRRLTTTTGGFAMMAAAYGGVFLGRSALCLVFPCTDASLWLYAPLVGPFVYAANAPNVGVGMLAVIDGLAQSVGTLLVVVGITTFREDLVPIPMESRARDPRRARMSWQFAPVIGATSAGLAMHLEW